jgi:hypothetical protein
MEFKQIVGEYSNKNQAFMYPCHYAMIRLVWRDLGENKLQSQSYYEYDYPNTSPYRQSYHKYDIINEHEVILHSYDMDWNPTCDHKIIWNANFWVAQTCGECIVKNIRIESEFKFNQEKCFSRDAGFNEDGKLVWGKEDGLFDFDRVV